MLIASYINYEQRELFTSHAQSKLGFTNANSLIGCNSTIIFNPHYANTRGTYHFVEKETEKDFEEQYSKSEFSTEVEDYVDASLSNLLLAAV